VSEALKARDKMTKLEEVEPKLESVAVETERAHATIKLSEIDAELAKEITTDRRNALLKERLDVLVGLMKRR
jgi:hypothetical protein